MAGNWQEILLQTVHEEHCEVFFNEPLARHTSFRIGGPADALVIVRSRSGLSGVWTIAQKYGVNITVIGRGTNVLISEQGLRGIVVKLQGEFCRIELRDNQIYAGAGVLLDEIADFAESHGFSGAEFLAGIPGTIGGGLMSNAGAYGRSLGDIVQQVEVMDNQGIIKLLNRGVLRNQYRESLLPAGSWALSVILKLQQGRAKSCQEIRSERRQKHPSEPSAGSFFKNPATVPAGKLIEQCGLKGIELGGAAVSHQHGNFIVNRGGARFVDVYELVQIIKATVEEMTGIELDEEVRILPPAGSAGDRR
ncbi:MAG: UDP-N-acetylmuramate dehydrogenase [candidate division WOR-3 bacterium]|uniref:UDP-N-acetylenolpyruvoylglucosamine reductase n=1 Tax=candidate division WOR-3 bacterium TaxID=2052148 RepID=A0A7C1NEP8_UNCW3|nr:UDP-N-acetylmuramate dehydrogenase [candidate division WOR-3 bacterium]